MISFSIFNTEAKRKGRSEMGIPGDLGEIKDDTPGIKGVYGLTHGHVAMQGK